MGKARVWWQEEQRGFLILKQETERTGQGARLLKPQRPPLPDTLSPTKPQLSILLRQFHQLQTKYSNPMSLWGPRSLKPPTLPFCISRQGSFIDVELTQQTRLAGHQGSGVPATSAFAVLELEECVIMPRFLCGFWGIKSRSLCIHKHFTSLAFSSLGFLCLCVCVCVHTLLHILLCPLHQSLEAVSFIEPGTRLAIIKSKVSSYLYLHAPKHWSYGSAWLCLTSYSCMFYVGIGDLNSGPHAYATSSFTSGPISQPWILPSWFYCLLLLVTYNALKLQNSKLPSHLFYWDCNQFSFGLLFGSFAYICDLQQQQIYVNSNIKYYSTKSLSLKSLQLHNLLAFCSHNEAINICLELDFPTLKAGEHRTTRPQRIASV